MELLVVVARMLLMSMAKQLEQQVVTAAYFSLFGKKSLCAVSWM